MNDSIPAFASYIEPAPVAFTPDAPGWYVVGCLLALALLAVAFFAGRRYRRNRYRRVALGWLEGEERRLLAAADYPRLVYVADMLLKRILIRLHKQEEAVSLRGVAWVDYLNRHCPAVAFTPGDAETISALYDSRRTMDRQQAVAFTSRAKRWIRKHRVGV